MMLTKKGTPLVWPTIIMLALIWPVGVMLMWFYTNWTKPVKFAVTFALVSLTLLRIATVGSGFLLI